MGDSGLHKLSNEDLDELFSSATPGLRRPAARQEHRTPGAMGVSVADLAAGLFPEEATTPAGEGSVEAPLECSLMFSRGGEPVSAVAVDEGFVQALIRFALDYAKTRSRWDPRLFQVVSLGRVVCDLAVQPNGSRKLAQRHQKYSRKDARRCVCVDVGTWRFTAYQNPRPT